MNGSASSRIRQGVYWMDAAAEMTAAGVGMLRRLVEAVGMLTVVAGVAIVLVPGVREAAAQAVGAMFSGDSQGDGFGAADSDSVDTAAMAARDLRLVPAEVSMAQYLSRRYHVADEAVRPLVAAARDAGRETQLDPLLILAVMAVESSMNPFAESRVGAQGLMQVMTSVHAEHFAQRQLGGNALDPGVNIRMGSAILSDLVRRGGSLERGLRLYVGAGNLPDDGGYAARVLSEMARLKVAAGGDVAGALSAGQRADAKSVTVSAGAATPVARAPGASES
jgi:soluble lytic murein transglycosylase-like protein